MQGLKSDELGFLVGKPISLTDLHDELAGINGELGEIKKLLSGDNVVGIAPDSIDEIVGGFASSIASENEKKAADAPDNISAPVSRDTPNTGLLSHLDKLIASHVDGIVQAGSEDKQDSNKIQARDGMGRFVSPVRTSESVSISESRDIGKGFAFPGIQPGKETTQAGKESGPGGKESGQSGKEISQSINQNTAETLIQNITNSQVLNNANGRDSSTRESIATNHVSQDSKSTDFIADRQIIKDSTSLNSLASTETIRDSSNSKSNTSSQATKDSSSNRSSTSTVTATDSSNSKSSTNNQAVKDLNSSESTHIAKDSSNSKSSTSKQTATDSSSSVVAKTAKDSSSNHSSTSTATAKDSKSSVNNQTVKDSKSRDANGRFISNSTTTAEKISTPKSRGANGQFLPKDPDIKSGSDKDSLGTKIKNVGGKIADSISGLSAGNDQADPSVQAMGEVQAVLSPVGRGLGKLFSGNTNGVSRGQDRWYRRFFKQNTEKARADELANKKEQKLLSNIEKKESPEVSSNSGLLATLFLAFMGMLATLLLKGFQLLVSPLKFLGTFFAPLLKVLQALARAIGLKKLADRLGSPSSKAKSNKPGSTGPAGTVKPGAGKAGTAKAVMKKLPIVGALMSAGFLGKELYDIAGNDESKEVKTKQVGSAVGSTAGGIGGALGGAAAGAAVGSMVPLVGTLVGGIVGAVLGGIGGDKLGGILGDKFGDWVNDLRDSGFIDRMSRSWDVGVNAMSIMWRDFTALASAFWSGMVSGMQSAWSSMVTGVQTGWNAVSNTTQLMWQNVTSAFTTASDFIKTSWTVTTTVIGGALNTVWTSLGELASQLNEAIKAKTGIDIAKNVNDLKSTVAGWGESLKVAFSDFTVNVKNSLSSAFGDSYLGSVIGEAQGLVDTGNERLSTTKEQDANQTGVLNAFLKAGFSKNQAVALTAEVGRENGYNAKHLYGYHKDEANGAVNMGMISWQGERAKRLEAHMQKKGLIKNGKMVRSQEALDAQAEFVKQEISSGGYKATQKLFSESPNLDPEAYAKTLGKDYIKWAYGQNTLSSGKKFDWKSHDAKRRAYMKQAQAKVKDAPTPGVAPAIPFRPGYNAQTAKDAIESNKAKTGQAKGQDAAKTAPAATKTADQAVATPTAGNETAQAEQKDSNSIESLMQNFNTFDGMANVKQAVVTLLKNSADNVKIAHHAPRTKPVVPAVSVSAAPQVVDAPKVSVPLTSQASNQDSNRKVDDVSRDLSDRRIAHIVTGAYSSPN
ncbi:phage tail tip lysozyme [Acinetobacter variabilis]|uniref:Phage tail lysozyme domain-containing protein n=1 Tax=Acinetobacter variabilis TaxID=70346 RepID=N8VK95_9GAMM|nr:phage tail tip lysozyme [Acinetobacter variabilis]ENV00347.1 hypothetical protein F969_00578 [Acinetobacter variabilis]